MNIIGDIAGQYKALQALLKKMPDDEILSVGDMIDRGPDSKQVLEWFMKHGQAILGNHEHMMLDAISEHGSDFYERGVWLMNGGRTTVKSFEATSYNELVKSARPLINWLKSLPLYVKLDTNTLVSHSFVHSTMKLKEACDLGPGFTPHYALQSDSSIIWNRSVPIQRNYFQIAGHNSQFGLRKFLDCDGDPYAICLDDSRKKKLTGLHWPSMRIYQQDFI